MGPPWRNNQDRLLFIRGDDAWELPPRVRPAAFYSHPRDDGLVNRLLGMVGTDHVHSFAATLSLPHGDLFCLGATFRSYGFLFYRLTRVALICDLLPACDPSNNRDRENQPLANRSLVSPSPTPQIDLPRSHSGDDMKRNGHLCPMGMPVGTAWGQN
jgi:hypothetical protein